jgi:hypothetical protein
MSYFKKAPFIFQTAFENSLDYEFPHIPVFCRESVFSCYAGVHMMDGFEYAYKDAPITGCADHDGSCTRFRLQKAAMRA